MVDVDGRAARRHQPRDRRRVEGKAQGGGRLPLDPRHLRRRRARRSASSCARWTATASTFEVEATELLARCLQHEIDHLHGKLFLDYLSVLKRTRGARRSGKLQQDKYPGFIRRTSLETPEDREQHEQPDEEL